MSIASWTRPSDLASSKVSINWSGRTFATGIINSSWPTKFAVVCVSGAGSGEVRRRCRCRCFDRCDYLCFNWLLFYRTALITSHTRPITTSHTTQIKTRNPAITPDLYTINVPYRAAIAGAARFPENQLAPTRNRWCHIRQTRRIQSEPCLRLANAPPNAFPPASTALLGSEAIASPSSSKCFVSRSWPDKTPSHCAPRVPLPVKRVGLFREGLRRRAGNRRYRRARRCCRH